MKKSLIITVSGKCGSGKSHLAFLLKKFLREQDFVVEVDFNSDIDYSTEENLDNDVNRNFNNTMNLIKNETKIILREEQLPRDYKIN
jgi:CO dehydrogenase nickel-insertion accessory protein CooC1